MRLIDSPLRTVCVHTGGLGAVLGAAAAAFGSAVGVLGVFAEPQWGAGMVCCCEGAARGFEGLGWAWDAVMETSKMRTRRTGAPRCAAHGSNSA